MTSNIGGRGFDLRNSYCAKSSDAERCIQGLDNVEHQKNRHSNTSQWRTKQWVASVPVNQQNGHEDYKPKKPGDPNTLSYHRLLNLVQRECNEVLLRLTSSDEALKSLLGSSYLRVEHIELIVAALGKACNARLHHFPIRLLLETIISTRFLTSHVSKLGAETPCDTQSKDRYQKFVCSVANIIDRLLEEIGKDAISEAQVVLFVCDRILINLIEQGSYSFLAVKDEFDRLEMKRLGLINAKFATSDFRDVSIIPDITELLGGTTRLPVKENILQGSYANTEEYLDTHFRLLREDFVMPLRDGIRDLASNQELLSTLVTTRIQSLHVYKGVSILYPACSSVNGVVHKLQFDVMPLGHIRWEATKRLIYGSLLCMFSNDFKTFLFATVISRNARGLQQGQLYVKFADLNLVTNVSPLDKLIMVESQAYFEAYRYILQTFQEFRKSLPFERYIVQVSTEVLAPSYLNYKSCFDLRTLAREPDLPEEKASQLGFDFFDPFDDITSDNFFARKSSDRSFEELKKVCVLSKNTWPKAEVLKLNDSQLDALKSALSSELCLIQGPPGTGKTYVGTKIVQALLENGDSWCPGVSNSPILVVCYTNHALDQFLEGILPYCRRKMIRIGGRSKSEALQPFTLQNIRDELRQRRKYPPYIHQTMRPLWKRMSELEPTIRDLSGRIRTNLAGVTRHWLLRNFMTDDQQTSLFEDYMLSPEFVRVSSGGDQDSYPADTVLLAWLGLLPATVGDELEENDVTEAKVEGSAVKGDIEDEEEKVVEEEEANRKLDGDGGSVVSDDSEVKEGDDLMLAIRLDTELPVVSTKSRDTAEWQVQINRRKVQQRLRRELKCPDSMSEEEALSVGDVWQLPLDQRWMLYRYWRSKVMNTAREQVVRYLIEYEEIASRTRELRQELDVNILREATVIGMTTTGASKYRTVVRELSPVVTIIEEAAEVLEAHVITALTEGCKHLILIGDHQQLRPSCASYELDQQCKLTTSLFERLILNKVQYIQLNTQHRMRPEICNLLVPLFYPDLTSHPSMYEYPHVPGMLHDMFFIDHCQPEDGHGNQSTSHSNRHEAALISSLVRYLMMQGLEPGEITVLCTYLEQARLIRRFCDGVKVSTVDNYQGEECRVILLSLVRSNKEGVVGFLKVPNRICVALSRAKHGFYVVGNLSMLATKTNLWRKIVEKLRDANRIGPALTLVCHNHPETKTVVSCASDFSYVPDGGCRLPCRAALVCGHFCRLYCHPTDSDHLLYKCPMPCRKPPCKRGHKCVKLCGEECGDCAVLVQKKMPQCNHVIRIPCHVELVEICSICHPDIEVKHSPTSDATPAQNGVTHRNETTHKGKSTGQIPNMSKEKNENGNGLNTKEGARWMHNTASAKDSGRRVQKDSAKNETSRTHTNDEFGINTEIAKGFSRMNIDKDNCSKMNAALGKDVRGRAKTAIASDYSSRVNTALFREHGFRSLTASDVSIGARRGSREMDIPKTATSSHHTGDGASVMNTSNEGVRYVKDFIRAHKASRDIGIQKTRTNPLVGEVGHKERHVLYPQKRSS